MAKKKVTLSKKSAAGKKPAAKKTAAKAKPQARAAARKPAAAKAAARKPAPRKPSGPKKPAAPRKNVASKARPAAKKRASSTGVRREPRSPEPSTLDGDIFPRAARRPRRGLGSEAAGQSGDLQGLSRREDGDSESVEELVEEGQFLEADAVSGVENALDPDQGEVRTRQVPTDDVPGEYTDND